MLVNQINFELSGNEISANLQFYNSYVPPYLYEITGPSFSADFIKWCGRPLTPPRIIAPISGRSGAEGGYRLLASFVPLCLLQKKRKIIAVAATVVAATDNSPFSNIYNVHNMSFTQQMNHD